MSKINENLYSSETNEWRTPQALVKDIIKALKETSFKHSNYDGFTTDTCCSEHNIPACYHCRVEGTFVGKEKHADEDGLIFKWQGLCWMNPPYGNDLKKFVEKASKEATTEPWTPKIIGILPVRTETKYYHEHILTKAYCYFFKGKVSFENDSKEGKAPFPVMLAFWGFCKPDVETICSHLNNFTEFKGTLLVPWTT